MKKAIIVVFITSAFVTLIVIIAWNIVTVVDTYEERGYHSYHSNDYGKWVIQSDGGEKRRVVIKHRLLTGDTWKQYLD